MRAPQWTQFSNIALMHTTLWSQGYFDKETHPLNHTLDELHHLSLVRVAAADDATYDKLKECQKFRRLWRANFYTFTLLQESCARAHFYTFMAKRPNFYATLTLALVDDTL